MVSTLELRIDHSNQDFGVTCMYSTVFQLTQHYSSACINVYMKRKCWDHFEEVAVIHSGQ